MKKPWDYAMMPLEPTVILTLDDVSPDVCEALCDRLDEGPANLGELANIAQRAGLNAQTIRLVELWLEKQRAARFVELVDGRWQVHCSNTSTEKPTCE